MSDVEEYRKRLEGSASGGNTEDYYKLARDQEYNLLLNKEVALENAKANAMKYTQNQINAQGFGGTGYGFSMQGGIYNNYMNKANEAYADYGKNIKNINAQENEENLNEANDRFQSVTTMINNPNVTSMDEINQMLADYNYGTYNADTKEFQWGEKPEDMSDDDWRQMQYYYRIQKNALDGTVGDGFNGAYARDEASFRSISIPIENGRHSTLGESFDKETSILFSHLNVGDVNFGDCIKMTNGHDKVVYVQFTRNGFRVISEKDYNNASSKHELVRNKKNKYSWQ